MTTRKTKIALGGGATNRPSPTKRYKTLILITVLSAVLITVVGVIRYANHLSKWPEENYSMLTSAAEDIFNAVGAVDSQSVDREQYCVYEAKQKYAAVQLYCGVKVIAYLPYQSDAHGADLARSLETEVSTRFGTVVQGLSEFNKNPEITKLL
jgi:hypothetical protein